MKTIGYVSLHYGAEYLDACIRAMEPHVEKIIILYTEHPSHGKGTDVQCPDSEFTLREIAQNASSKIDWNKVVAGHEGQHRDYFFRYTSGYDVGVTADADEVWDTESLGYAIKTAYDGPVRRYRVDGFINFWKSFNEVCYDWFHPVRLWNLKHSDGETDLMGRIYHFGTAQREEIMRYKYLIHGHRDELRPNWLNDVYFSDQKHNLHCTSNGIWDAVPFDKSVLPELLKQHPNYLKERI